MTPEEKRKATIRLAAEVMKWRRYELKDTIQNNGDTVFIDREHHEIEVRYGYGMFLPWKPFDLVSHAWQLIDVLSKEWDIECHTGRARNKRILCTVTMTRETSDGSEEIAESAETMPMAICLAALGAF